MDITYYDSGYIADNYFVYTANAQVALAQYVTGDYFTLGYFDDTQASVTLTCSAERIRFVNISADLVVATDTSITGVKDVRAEVTLANQTNVNCQALRTRDPSAAVTASSDLTVTTLRTREVSVEFNSTVAQLSLAARNARGLIVMESRVTMTAIVGVIRQFTLVSAVGVSSNSESAAARTPYLKYGTAETSVNTFQSRMLWSFYLAKPIGFIFDSDNNSPGPTALSVFANGLRVETSDGIPRFIYHAHAGAVQFALTNVSNNDSAEFNSVYRHYLFCVDLSKSTTAEKFRLFLDGTEIAITGITGSDFSMRVYGSYNLMMQTSGTGVNKRIAVQSSGYGDDGGLVNGPGHLTQFWWDYGAASYDLSPAARAQFYPGFYQSLGLNGTATGLAQPKHFVNLANVDDLLDGGTENDTWVWRQLQGPDGNEFLEEVPFYTAPQNSNSPLRGLRVISQFVVAANSVIVSTVSLISNLLMATTPGRVQTGLVTLVSNTTLSCQATRRQQATVDMITGTAITALVGVIEQGAADIVVTTVSATDSTRTRVAQVAAQVNTAVTVTAGVVTPFQVTHLSDTAMSVVTVRVRGHAINTQTQVSLSAVIDNRLRVQSAQIVSQSQLVCDAVNLEGIDSVMAVTSQLTVATQVVKVTQAALISTVTQQSQGIKVVNGAAQLSVQAFELSVIIVINMAPELSILVPSQTRTRVVTPRDRQMDVEMQSRIAEIPQQTRVLTIQDQTLVNTI